MDFRWQILGVYMAREAPLSGGLLGSSGAYFSVFIKYIQFTPIREVYENWFTSSTSSTFTTEVRA